ncbi:MAG: ankyrin repeat domain-containing protein [Nitrosomonadales bacterium]|nr:ankyrin repeat domain-containing protein [Nitrosomonadales bacterium]
MDIVKQKQIREWTLLSLVGAMALLSNLPAPVLAEWHIDPGVIMPILGLLVMLALMLYVRFFFFLLFTLLIIGSNLPDTWAERYGLSREIFMATLIALICVYLLNYGLKLLPTGLEPKKKSAPNPDATTALIKAIERDNLPHIKSVLSFDFDLDAPSEQGITPLMSAAQKGNLEAVEMLLKRGASALVRSPLWERL